MNKEMFSEQAKKSMDAFSDMGKMSMEFSKSIAQMQTAYMKEAFEEVASMAKEMMSAPISYETHKNSMNRVKDSMNKASEHASKVSQMFVKANNDVQHKMQNSMGHMFDEMKFANMNGSKK